MKRFQIVAFKKQNRGSGRFGRVGVRRSIALFPEANAVRTHYGFHALFSITYLEAQHSAIEGKASLEIRDGQLAHGCAGDLLRER